VGQAETTGNGHRPAASGRYRQVTPAMRGILWVGVVLVFVAGSSLFVLTGHTERYFAWTIKVPLSAAFLGAFYYTACVIALLSVRRPEWARARVGIPGVTVFLWLTMLATLLHLDLFHLSSGIGTARGAAWIWLAIYVADPIAMAVIWFFQVREPGEDTPRVAALPGGYGAVLLLEGVALFAVGLFLFVAPASAAHIWPWPLTPLTSRMSAAWLVGLGITLVCAAAEADWDRIRPATAGLIALVVFQGIALVRYSGAIAWGTPQARGYVALLALNLIVGIAGVVSGRARQGAA